MERGVLGRNELFFLFAFPEVQNNIFQLETHFILFSFLFYLYLWMTQLRKWRNTPLQRRLLTSTVVLQQPSMKSHISPCENCQFSQVHVCKTSVLRRLFDLSGASIDPSPLRHPRAAWQFTPPSQLFHVLHSGSSSLGKSAAYSTHLITIC